MTWRPFPLALLVVVPLVLAGCTGGGQDPAAPTAQGAPATAREDTKEFIVGARGSLEYKLAMDEGARMEFSWSAPGALYFDFHGDREGDTSGAFTRHKSGTATLDKGTFTAPFEGRHGWYWENKGSQGVTVTLTTKGEYAIVGITG